MKSCRGPRFFVGGGLLDEGNNAFSDSGSAVTSGHHAMIEPTIPDRPASNGGGRKAGSARMLLDDMDEFIFRHAHNVDKCPRAVNGQLSGGGQPPGRRRNRL